MREIDSLKCSITLRKVCLYDVRERYWKTGDVRLDFTRWSITEVIASGPAKGTNFF